MRKETNAKKLADQLFPIKASSDEESELLNIPPDQRRLHTETYDFSVATIHEYLKKKYIYIPKFQRMYVWNRVQASRLIESLVIQCPIPVIYLNQESDERLSVIDGNQRLQSLQLFLEDGFALNGLKAYPELEDTLYSELDSRIQRHILNRTLRCIVILKDTHPRIKFDVFERLNTGAVQLNPQEIRHGIYHGALIDTIDNLSDNITWKEVSGYANDKRMKGSELILRFFALNEDLDRYQKPLSAFLNDYCDKNQFIQKDRQRELESLFMQTISGVKQLLGQYAFRTFDEQGSPNKNINAALFDAQMVGISRLNGDLPVLSIEGMREKLIQLYSEEDFKESITSGTSTTKLVKYRIARFYTFLESLGR